jgi:RNA polymerase sigma-70 factor (sigma-E family)
MDADEAIAGLLAECGDRLLRLAYQLCHDRSTAEDLVQQALEQTYRSWRRRRPDVTHAEAYVRKVIVNEHLRRKRLRAATEVVTETVPDAVSDTAAAGFAESFGDRDELWTALATLPARQRAVLVLRYYEDLPDAQIAGLLGCRDVTVRSLASRGLAALRASELSRSPEGVRDE